jgi:hypothetical protein
MTPGAAQTGQFIRTTVLHIGWRAVVLVVALAIMGGTCAAQVPADRVSASPSLDILARARKHVQEYFENFSDLTCIDSVTQLVLNASGRTIYRENSSYDYQFQTSEQDGALKFHETREPRTPAFRDPARTLLVTTGFASLLLVAHPMYAASYEFQPDGADTIKGISYIRIRFKSVIGASSPAALRLRGRNYPLPLSGTLWVEPQSGVIVKLEATVNSDLSDIGLAGMHSEVHFALHQFHGARESMWVPDFAVIDLETPRQHWRNLHRFTAYKKFDVDIHQEIGQNQ